MKFVWLSEFIFHSPGTYFQVEGGQANALAGVTRPYRLECARFSETNYFPIQNHFAIHLKLFLG